MFNKFKLIVLFRLFLFLLFATLFIYFKHTCELSYQLINNKPYQGVVPSNTLIITITYDSYSFELNLIFVCSLVIYLIILHFIITVMYAFKCITYNWTLKITLEINIYICILLFGIQNIASLELDKYNLSILIHNLFFKKLWCPLVLDSVNSSLVFYVYIISTLICLCHWDQTKSITTNDVSSLIRYSLILVSLLAISVSLLFLVLSWLQFNILLFITGVITSLSFSLFVKEILDLACDRYVYNYNYFFKIVLFIFTIELIITLIAVYNVYLFCNTNNVDFLTITIKNKNFLQTKQCLLILILIALFKLIYIWLYFLIYPYILQITKNSQLLPLVTLFFSGIFFIPGIYILVRFHLFTLVSSKLGQLIILLLFFHLSNWANHNLHNDYYADYFYIVLGRLLTYSIFNNVLFSYFLCISGFYNASIDSFIFYNTITAGCLFYWGNLKNYNELNVNNNRWTQWTMLINVSFFIGVLIFAFYFFFTVVYLEELVAPVCLACLHLKYLYDNIYTILYFAIFSHLLINGLGIGRALMSGVFRTY